MGSYRVERETRDGVEVVALHGPDGAAARLAPALGNNCFEYVARASVLEPVDWDAFRARPTSYGIPILFPYPNRVRDGRFRFRGETYEVEPRQHGYVRQRPWAFVDAGAADGAAWAVSRFDASEYPDEILAQFPWPFRLEAEYRLEEGALTLRLAATSRASTPFPVGFGIHPYFRRPEEGTVRVPARERWELEEQLPTGRLLEASGPFDLSRGADLGSLALDDVFTGLEADAEGEVRCAIEDAALGLRTEVRFSRAEFPNVVVYTPPAPRRAVCVEPMTCPTDAFNLADRGVDANVIVLEPDETRTFRIRIATTAS